MKNKIAVKLAALAMFAAVSANAATWYWTGEGGDLNWFTPANWNTAADGTGDAASALASGDSFTFDAFTPSGDVNYNPSGDFNITTVTFGTGLTATVKITGAKITSLGNAVNNNTTYAMEFANEVDFSSTINLKFNTKQIVMSGGATGTQPANHSTLVGKYTMTASEWATGSTSYTLAENSYVKVNGNVKEARASGNMLSIKRGAVLDIQGQFSATPYKDGNIQVFSELSGTVIARSEFRVNCWTGSANSGGHLNIAGSNQSGVICASTLNITPLNNTKLFRFHVSRFVCLGGFTYRDEKSRWAALVFPETFIWTAGEKDFTLPGMTGRNGASLSNVSFGFDTTDWFDKTTGRTITINGNISNQGSSTKAFSAFGKGKVVFNCDYTNCGGGLIASNGVTVAIRSGARPGSSSLTMKSGTKLAIESSITTGAIGGSGSVTFEPDTTFAVNFTSTNAAPVLAFNGASTLTLPETGSVSVKVTADEGLHFNFGDEYEITSGGKFPADAVTSGKVVLTDDSPAWAILYVNASGDLAVKVADYFYIKIAGTEDMDLPVPMQWLDDNGIAAADDSIKSVVDALTENGANGIPVWQSYCMGLDPRDAGNAVFCAAAAEQPSEAGKVAIEVSRSFVPAELSGVTVKAYLDVKRPGHDWDFDETGETVSSGAISRTAEISDPGISFFA